MSWSMIPYRGPAADFDPNVQVVQGGDINEREPEIIDAAMHGIKDIAASFGDCLVMINASGSIGPETHVGGDVVQVHINSLPADPPPPEPATESEPYTTTPPGGDKA